MTIVYFVIEKKIAMNVGIEVCLEIHVPNLVEVVLTQGLVIIQEYVMIFWQTVIMIHIQESDVIYYVRIK